MSKIIKWLITFIIFVTVIIFCISMYLQPNDLGQCEQKPGFGENCQIVDAIVVISGGDTLARAGQAIDLYKNGWSDKIIFSGAAQDKSGPSNAAVMKKMAISAGIPKSDIYIDEYSETTGQNALNAQTIFAENNIKRVILVTSGYHQRRASLEFNKRAGDVTILNSPVQNDKDWSFWWWVTPRGWWLATGEVVKIVAFYTTGA